MIEPSAGILLIADPFLKDPNFLRSVVLICDHKEEGSFGFVLNREYENTLDELIPQLEDFKQKYNDSQTELTTTKDKLSKTEVDKHLLEIRVTDLNNEITRNNTRITDLEKRPNISSEEWTKDYSQRPSKVELDKIKGERDQRPNISLEDYQKLSGTKSELAK